METNQDESSRLLRLIQLSPTPLPYPLLLSTSASEPGSDRPSMSEGGSWSEVVAEVAVGATFLDSEDAGCSGLGDGCGSVGGVRRRALRIDKRM